MKIRYEVVSDVGHKRSNNEDMALVFGSFVRDSELSSMVPMARRPRFTALVADGMGGYGGGEIASEMTLHSFNTFIGALPPDLSPREVAQVTKEWFRVANDDVIARAATDPALTNMGCTLTGIFTYGQTDYMINAGDSRVYRWRYRALRQLSTDHSERERSGDSSVPSNLIYNAVGVSGAFVDVTNLTDEMPVIDGDVYIICSDGLCDMVTDEVIAKILDGGGTAADLVDAALDAGGDDNCTVIMLTVSIPTQEEAPIAEFSETSETSELSEFSEHSEISETSDEFARRDGFTIDEEPMALADDEITEEEAAKLPPAQPTSAERLKIASSRILKALDSLLGKR